MITHLDEAIARINDTHLTTQEREEAIHYLKQHPNPAGVAPLVQALEDGDPGIRWAAAEALSAFPLAELRPLLEALVRSPDSVWLREGAHHVLTHLRRTEEIQQVQALRDALQGEGAIYATEMAAVKLLEHIS
ncbi:MAG: hypothetical protein KatS3mg050_2419 [Litorilinea sp.]|nr:MAG: hypothetical protein KatS3mg050_2419 [Litorilinea sp.]